ncbi:MAG: hypothetical protein GWN67_12535 [Phycisphaerae bacterium]|nr:hypothetical protein [Phycisphaerae bacterium]NIP50736.1 hypothetical protein [Phycisphaerae bacterium]NIS53087.1 hypothetical protein [Phycisphaerae bacterium]NIU07597.1 hypothetical protein [Phycisphaerae bacterium]NIU57171.1 hypothetical protein [Phycisphaerae bacterium]
MRRCVNALMGGYGRREEENVKIKMKNAKLLRPFGQIFMEYRDYEDISREA